MGDEDNIWYAHASMRKHPLTDDGTKESHSLDSTGRNMGIKIWRLPITNDCA